MISRLRADALSIFQAGVEAVDPYRAVRDHLSLEGDKLLAGGRAIPLLPGGRIVVVGAGKAGAPMAAAVEDILGDRLSEGLVTVKDGHLGPTRTVRLAEASHPVPDERGRAGAEEMAALLRRTGPDDLVVCLISGGGSALLPLPAPPLTLADKQAVTGLLLASGADITEVNAVRKHLSQFKGGGLARLAAPSRVLALILSDVVGDPLDVIASGPTVADPTTFADALAVLERYRLLDLAPPSVTGRLRSGAEGQIPETPKPGGPELESAINVLVATNAIALAAARARADGLGYRSFLLPEPVTGEARSAGARMAELARMIASRRVPAPLPACVLGGGETTVTVRGRGKGGRNQELALSAAIQIDGLLNVLILSGGTDGTDGPTDAAGAMADGQSVERARALGLEPRQFLENNDSYNLFSGLGDLVVTGPTRTNVMDIQILLVGSE